MIAHVPVKICSLPETFCAHATLKRSLALMNVANVALQVAADTEAAGAVETFVRLLARVRANVPSEVGGTWKAFAAKLALIAIPVVVVVVIIIVVVVTLQGLDDDGHRVRHLHLGWTRQLFYLEVCHCPCGLLLGRMN